MKGKDLQDGLENYNQREVLACPKLENLSYSLYSKSLGYGWTGVALSQNQAGGTFVIWII